MTILHKTGDLFDAYPEMAIGHGVNCHGLMGSGIAVGFRRAFPSMFTFYENACRNGTLKPGGCLPWLDEQTDQWVYNLATQNTPGADARTYWIYDAFKVLCEHTRVEEVGSVAVPRIGAGIGGLKWEAVQDQIRDALKDSTQETGWAPTIVVYTLP